VLLATGATLPRDLKLPGRELKGIHFAMDFLTRNTKSLLDSNFGDDTYIDARGKDVVVIGGGDTGADCIGTALRHGARSVVNFELLQQPPAERDPDNPWPQWPRILYSDYSHVECKQKFGADPRTFAALSREFIGDGHGNVHGVRTVHIDWSEPGPNAPFREIPGTEKIWPADLVLLSLGFLGPERSLSDMLGIQYDARGNYRADETRYGTTVPSVFATGDCRRGQSLVVWAIREGRGAAQAIHAYLNGTQDLDEEDAQLEDVIASPPHSQW
jgi:NADPH-dependent glutamate synthase beta subunit-like oxidoreductase